MNPESPSFGSGKIYKRTTYKIDLTKSDVIWYEYESKFVLNSRRRPRNLEDSTNTSVVMFGRTDELKFVRKY